MQNWFLKNSRDAYAHLRQVCPSLSPLVALLLAGRGVTEPDAVQTFLSPKLEHMHDPMHFRDMHKAVDLLLECLESEIPIRIVGDYDQDGVSSTVILMKGLRAAAHLLHRPTLISYSIPDRLDDGYGLNRHLVDLAAEDGAGLILTCDNGIAAFDAVQYAKKRGLFVLITDHHQVVTEEDREILPEADVILNPHMRESGYPFADLCGAGVALKLMEGLFATLGRKRETIADLLPFAALGTICDVVPLLDENRVIAAEGLKRLQNAKNPGIRALLCANAWRGEVTAYTVGFIIGPCINASGRLFNARLGVELFLERDPETVETYARQLVALNAERKQMTEAGTKAGMEAVEKLEELPPVLILYMPTVHESLCGLVAGRLRERYGRPTIVLTDAQEVPGQSPRYKGSGRSIARYNMFHKLDVFRDMYESFGGHAMACGLTIPSDRFETWKDAVCRDAGLQATDYIREIRMDGVLTLPHLNRATMDALQTLEPTGASNPRPLFAARSVNVRSMRLVGKNQRTLQLRLEQGGAFFTAVLFRADDALQELRHSANAAVEALLHGQDPGLTVDIAYHPQWHTYQDRVSIQLELSGIRLHTPRKSA